MSNPVALNFVQFQELSRVKLLKEAQLITLTRDKTSNKKKSRKWQVLEHAVFLTSQAKALTSSFLSHHWSGPSKPSWPVPLTLANAISNTFANYTHLAKPGFFRGITSFAHPLVPSNIMTTPVAFRVRRCGLDGILKELDEKETGRREITGEWVVSKELWLKLNQEYHMSTAHQKHIYVDPDGQKWSTEKIVMFLHGGAYWLCSAKTHRDFTYRISEATQRRVFGVNYGLAPEAPFPCGLHDAVHAFMYLTDPKGLAIQPENVVVAGDSAGGGLTLALLLYLRDNHMPLPGGAVVFSPWCDLTMACPSWDQNHMLDLLFKLKDDEPLNPVRLYLNPYEERAHLRTNPYVSPIFGEMNDLPPLLLQCGDSEVLRDEICVVARKAEQSGTFVQLEVYDDMVHIFQTFPFLEQTKRAFESVGNFVQNVMPLHQKNTLRSHPLHRTFSLPEFDLPPQIFGSIDGFSKNFAASKPSMCDKSTSTDDDETFIQIPLKMIPKSPTTALHSKSRANSFGAKNRNLNISQYTIQPHRATSHPDLNKVCTALQELSTLHCNYVNADMKGCHENLFKEVVMMERASVEA